MTNEMERNGLMGERLLRLRNQSSLTQEELAERLDVSRQSISKWELNKTLPDVDKLIQLSEMYQVSIDYLIKGEEALEEERQKGEPEKEAAAVADDMDKTAKDEKKTGGNNTSAAEFTARRIILCICIFLSGALCLLAVVFTGRLLKNNAFDREGTQDVVHVRKIYEQYTKAEITGADFDREMVWLDVPGVREGDYVFCYPDGEQTAFDYYTKTWMLPMILGIVFLIFLIVFIMEWRLDAAIKER